MQIGAFQKIKGAPFFGLLPYLYLLILISCNSDSEIVYNPCLSSFKLQAFWPATASLDWLPNIQDDPFIFIHNSKDSLQFHLTQFRDPQEFLSSHFFITCPQDTLQRKPVDYTLKAYHYRLENMDTSHQVSDIPLALAPRLDEMNSTYDKVLLTDVLSVNITLKGPGEIPLFQFPVLDRGYLAQTNFRYLFKDSLNLDQRQLQDVFYNDENPYQIRIYYSISGIEAIEYSNKVYFRNQ